MEPVRTITPPGGAQQALPSRPAPIPVAQAVATELSAAKAVTAANSAGPTINNAPGRSDSYEYQVLVDPATHDVIYRTVDERSRQVVRQVPDQALLRMRAYARALPEDKSADEGHEEANIRAPESHDEIFCGAPDPHSRV
jgi:hypothetical protein